MYMALSEYTCVRKLCLAPRHSGRDAFSRAIIFLLRSVTKYYSLTLKITASVLHGLRKCVRELMVSDNRWLTLCVQVILLFLHAHITSIKTTIFCTLYCNCHCISAE